jgi:hypothetical protein
VRATLRRWGVWAFVWSLAAYSACSDPPPPTIYYEDFESLCEGVPCGWERTRGEEAQATWIETIHEGEHGLRLSGEVTVHGPATIVEDDGFLGTLTLHTAARCDAGSGLRIDLVFADAFGGRYNGFAQLGALPEWTDEVDVRTLAWESTMPGTITDVLGVTITKTGEGACEISSVLVSDVPFEPGC